MARTEARLGATSALGTTYTNIYTVPASTVANVLLNVTARVSATFRAYVAASGWSTGEPTGATLVAAITYDQSIGVNDPPFQVSGIVMNAGEKLVVRSDTASSIDVIAAGVTIA